MDAHAQLDGLIQKLSNDTNSDSRELVPESVMHIAGQTGLQGWQIEARSLELGITPSRYRRNAQAMDATGQTQLLNSRVAVVGLGGLGGIAVETLARAGVGRIRAADHDSFEPSNLNRQALATMDTLSMTKAETARRRLSAINPSVAFEALAQQLTNESLDDFLRDADVVIDALGGLEMRLPLEQAAARNNIPMVSGALAGWTGYVAVVMPGQSGPAHFMGTDNAAEERLGCPVTTVNVISSIMIHECIRLLCTGKSPLSGRMLIVDLNTLTQEIVTI
jgi:molybdopterin/thiamine biosynthesis adenylyltransferase